MGPQGAEAASEVLGPRGNRRFVNPAVVTHLPQLPLPRCWALCEAALGDGGKSGTELSINIGCHIWKWCYLGVGAAQTKPQVTLGKIGKHAVLHFLRLKVTVVLITLQGCCKTLEAV